MPFLFQTSTTAQQIMDSVAQDVRQTISSTALPDTTILLDHIDRVSKEMLRRSRWMFLESLPQQFITQLGVSDYWIGPNQTGPLTAYDTALNLTDLRLIKPKSVLDRSNFLPLGHMNEAPLAARLAYADGSSRPGRPAVWRQDEASPFILSLYPAADNQNNFQPQPISPIATRVISGALANRFYYLTVTFVDEFGNESTAPSPSRIFIPANSLVVVNPPQEPIPAGTSGVHYDRYNVYAGTDADNLILQSTGTNLDNTVTWTEPTTGLETTGVNPPATNTLEPLDGYIIEFQYYKLRVPVVAVDQILQIPDDYSDVVKAGVNAFAFGYLTRPSEAQKWYAIYQDGLGQIVRDINNMVRGGDYISPDPASTGQTLASLDNIPSPF